MPAIRAVKAQLTPDTDPRILWLLPVTVLLFLAFIAYMGGRRQVLTDSTGLRKDEVACIAAEGLYCFFAPAGAWSAGQYRNLGGRVVLVPFDGSAVARYDKENRTLSFGGGLRMYRFLPGEKIGIPPLEQMQPLDSFEVTDYFVPSLHDA